MLRRASALVAAVALCVLVTVAPASAHAELVSSNPTDGATLPSLPAEVVLTFDENVGTPAYVSVTDADGTSVASGEAAIDGATVTQRLSTTAAAGTYSLAYRVVSDDGHPVTGTLGFTVTGDTTSPAPETSQEAPSPAQKSFVERHADHIVVGAVLLLAALGLLALSRRRE